MVFLAVVAGARHAKIVVAPKVDVVVRRILAVVDILGFLFLHFLERNRLLGLEHRLGNPLVAALDADDRIVLAEIVEAFTALGARALGAPLWLDHENVLVCPPRWPAVIG